MQGQQQQETFNPYLSNAEADDTHDNTNNNMSKKRKRMMQSALVFYDQQGSYTAAVTAAAATAAATRTNHQQSKMPLLQLTPPLLIEPWDQGFFQPTPSTTILDTHTLGIHPPAQSTDPHLAMQRMFHEMYDEQHHKYALENEETHQYIQHPVSMESAVPGSNDPPVALKVYPTKKEQKRMRRQAREVINQEKRNLIAIGDMAPPPPRVTMKNIVQVYGSETVLNPSEMELIVKQSMEDRHKKHLANNYARMTTPEERWKSFAGKIQRDKEENALEVAVFRVNSLHYPENLGPKWRGKINNVARKFGLNGVAMMIKRTDVVEDASTGLKVGFNLVVVEGGPKGIEKFSNVMLHTIKWNGFEKDEKESDDDEDGAMPIDNENSTEMRDGGEERVPENRCWLVWRGSMPHARFEKFQMFEKASIEDMKKELGFKRLGELFDLALQIRVDAPG